MIYNKKDIVIQTRTSLKILAILAEVMVGEEKFNINSRSSLATFALDLLSSLMVAQRNVRIPETTAEALDMLERHGILIPRSSPSFRGIQLALDEEALQEIADFEEKPDEGLRKEAIRSLEDFEKDLDD